MNASNASITFIANVTGGALTFWGLAPTGVPEPSTCAMLLTGLAGVGFAARCRARNAAGTA